jgi:predicted GTPase
MKRKKKVVRKKRQTKVEKLKTLLRAEQARMMDFRQRVIDAENRVIQQDKMITELQRKVGKEFVWIMRDGQPIRPSAMEEGHLRNTICFLQRHITYKVGTATWLSGLEDRFRAMYEMLKEARRRGIEV